MNANKQHGFTLVEVMLVLVIMGIAASAASGLMNQIAGFYAAERDLQNSSELRAIADAHVKYAAVHNAGAMVGSFDSTECNSCPIDTTVTELTNYVENRTQRTANASNYDSTSVFNVRGLMFDSTVYQATLNLPSAINVVLEYTAGVVVQTNCPKGAACDTSESWKTPAYTQAAWVPHASITKSVPFNNLEVLQNLATGTVERVVYVQQKIREYTQEMVISNPADIDSNYLPVSNLPSSPDYTGSNPSSNGGCINGWYDLSSSDVNLLAIVGLESSYGSTLFGGVIEYCADLDLTALDASTADTAPHIGALRINRFVTRGDSPSITNTNNILFPI